MADIFVSEMRETETADEKKKSKNQAEPHGWLQWRMESKHPGMQEWGVVSRVRSMEKNASQFSSEDRRNQRGGEGGDAASGWSRGTGRVCSEPCPERRLALSRLPDGSL